MDTGIFSNRKHQGHANEKYGKPQAAINAADGYPSRKRKDRRPNVSTDRICSKLFPTTLTPSRRHCQGLLQVLWMLEM